MSYVPRLSVCLSLVCLGGCSEPDYGSFRHVVLISLDTTRADHLDPYAAAPGGLRSSAGLTPRIGALSREGIVFEQVLSPAPTTLAAHTSIMTGCYPQTHGVPRNGFMIDRRNVMLAELLGDAGFHTAGFLGSFALLSVFDFDQGFDAWDEEFDQLAFAGEAGRDQNQRTADRVTDAVLAHVAELGEGERERLFLFAHYFDAHQPYEPPLAFVRRWCQPGARETSTSAEMVQAIAEHTARILGQPMPNDELINNGLVRPLIERAGVRPSVLDRELADLYAGEVAFVDAEIGRLLDGLEREGILDDALVIVTGDHGETFWEHGDYWNHGLWVYGSTVKVPLVVRFPDRRGAGTRVPTPVSTVDLVPTLCDLLGLGVPPRADGVSLGPLLAGEELARGPLFSQATQPLKIEPRGYWRNLLKPRCVLDGKWKYVQAPYLTAAGSPTLQDPGLEQLFDLEQDPGEQRNLLVEPLAPEAEAAYGELRAALEQWVRSADPYPAEFNREQFSEVMRQLQELGYAPTGQSDQDEEGEDVLGSKRGAPADGSAGAPRDGR